MPVHRKVIRVKDKKWWNSLRFKEQEEFSDATVEDQSQRQEGIPLPVTKSGKVRGLESCWTKKGAQEIFVA